jgi:hypothetical protein
MILVSAEARAESVVSDDRVVPTANLAEARGEHTCGEHKLQIDPTEIVFESYRRYNHILYYSHKEEYGS